MKLKDTKLRLPKTGAIYAIVLFSILYSVLLHGQYLTLTNIVNVLRQSSTLCILTIAAFLTILTHQLDLAGIHPAPTLFQIHEKEALRMAEIAILKAHGISRDKPGIAVINRDML